MANPNVFTQLIQPIRSVADYSGDIDRQEAQRLALQGQRRTNALQDAAFAQQTDDRAALQLAAQQSGGDSNKLIAALRQSGRPALFQQADAIEKSGLDRRKVESEANGKDVETENKVISVYRDMIGMAQSPQAAAELVRVMHSDPRLANTAIARVPVEQGLSQIGGDPQGFAQWKQQFGLGATKFIEQNKPTLTTQNLGGTSRIVSTPGLGGASTVATEAPITQTADNRATQQTAMRGQNMTDARSREANALTREGQQSQVVNDPTQGIMIVNKGTGIVRPGMRADGTPVTADSVAKKQAAAKSTLSILDEADSLIDQATGSYAGAGIDQAARVFGKTTGGAEATAKLKVLEGGLMMAQPRMEGPQSDKDTMLYRQMAGQIGDPTVPREIKKAALAQIRTLQEKYSGAAQATPTASGVPPDIAALLKKHGGK